MKRVILISGLDSCVLFEMLNRKYGNIIPVYFKFNLPNQAREMDNLPKETIIYDVPEQFGFSKADFENGNIPDLYGRTTLMHVLAAKALEPDEIYSGVLDVDGFTESTYAARKCLSATLSLMLGKDCDVVWTLYDKAYSKQEIVNLALGYGLDIEKLVSCHHEQDCYECKKCADREIALMNEGRANHEAIEKLLNSGALYDFQHKNITDYYDGFL